MFWNGYVHIDLLPWFVAMHTLVCCHAYIDLMIYWHGREPLIVRYALHCYHNSIAKIFFVDFFISHFQISVNAIFGTNSHIDHTLPPYSTIDHRLYVLVKPVVFSKGTSISSTDTLPQTGFNLSEHWPDRFWCKL